MWIEFVWPRRVSNNGLLRTLCEPSGSMKEMICFSDRTQLQGVSLHINAVVILVLQPVANWGSNITEHIMWRRKCAVREKHSRDVCCYKTDSWNKFPGQRIRVHKLKCFPEIATRFVATGNNGGHSTVRLGDLYSVRMKLVQSEILRSRSRVQ
jgi:hypothetical protein